MVTYLRDRIIESCELEKEALTSAQDKSRQYKNINAKSMILHPNVEVLLLIQQASESLSDQWQGPFKVIRQISDMDYLILVRGKEKVFHVNMLTKFYK